MHYTAIGKLTMLAKNRFPIFMGGIKIQSIWVVCDTALLTFTGLYNHIQPDRTTVSRPAVPEGLVAGSPAHCLRNLGWVAS